MNIMGHTIPFYACSWLKDKEPRLIGAYVLEAKNAAERRQRLQWLWEGSLVYHLNPTRQTIEGREITPDGCPIEKALFMELISFLANRKTKQH